MSLSANAIRVAELMAIGYTAAKAAAEVGISDEHISRRYMKDPDFLALRSRLIHENIGPARDTFMAQASNAAELYGKVIESGTRDDTVRLNAARDVMAEVHKLHAIADSAGVPADHERQRNEFLQELRESNDRADD